MNYVSIVIPAYNVAKYITATIQSIVDSIDIGKNDYEIIVVNDGSTDGLSNKVEEIRSKYPDANILLLEQDNCGVSVARNYGLSKVRGEYVWFIDGDDCIMPYSLKFLIEIIKNNKVDAIKIGKVIRNTIVNKDLSLSSTDLPIPSLNKNEIVDAYQVLDKNLGFGHTTFIWNSSFLRENRLHYPENITHNEDQLFMLQAISKASKVVYNPSMIFYLVRSRSDSASRQLKSSKSFIQYCIVQSSMILTLSLAIKLRDQGSKWEKEKLAKYNDYIDEMAKLNASLCFFSGQKVFYYKYYLSVLKAMNVYPLRNTDGFPSYITFMINHSISFYIVGLILRFMTLIKLLITKNN